MADAARAAERRKKPAVANSFRRQSSHWPKWGFPPAPSGTSPSGPASRRGSSLIISATRMGCSRRPSGRWRRVSDARRPTRLRRRANARADPGGDRRQPRAGGIRPADVQRLARLLGTGDSFARLQARPERLSAAHALEPPPRSRAARAGGGSAADGDRGVGDDRRAVAQGHSVRATRNRQRPGAGHGDRVRRRAMNWPGERKSKSQRLRGPQPKAVTPTAKASRGRAQRVRNHIGGGFTDAAPPNDLHDRQSGDRRSAGRDRDRGRGERSSGPSRRPRRAARSGRR